MARTKIEWTQETWNCLAGCEAISPGCAHCYAATMTRRLEGMGQADYAGLTNDKHFNGVVRCLPHKLDIPLKRKKPTVYFVNSMSDLFHEDVPDEFIDRVFATMYQAQWHTYQVLTKRADRMHAYMTAPHRMAAIGTAAFALASRVAPEKAAMLSNSEFVNDLEMGMWPLPQVWLGVSAENQKRLDERWDWLRRTPAAVRFLSCEPLLGPLVFDNGWSTRTVPWSEDGQAIHWVIVGGESGPGSRPCNAQWIRDIRQQCEAANVPCFIKQLGARPCGIDCRPIRDKKGGDPAEWPEDLRVRQFPAAATGGAK